MSETIRAISSAVFTMTLTDMPAETIEGGFAGEKRGSGGGGRGLGVTRE